MTGQETVALHIFAIGGLPEIHSGDSLGTMIAQAITSSGHTLQEGDILVVAQKAVSKAEGRLVQLETVTPSPFAVEYARQWDKDARVIEVVLRESRRIVRMDRGVLITETHHGFVCANAAVDASNAPASGVVVLLPIDPDASAALLRAEIASVTGIAPAIIMADTFGRPWREGIVNVAIGVAGINPLHSYVGQHDPQGYELRVTVLAVADELASAAELVMGKIARVPVALIRGFVYQPDEGGSASALVRDPARDLFR